jgi:hypothetical protein
MVSEGTYPTEEVSDLIETDWLISQLPSSSSEILMIEVVESLRFDRDGRE